MARGFVLRNVEEGKCRYFNANEPNENNLILESSQLIANKEDLLELQIILDDSIFVEQSTGEKSSTGSSFWPQLGPFCSIV